MMTNGSCFLLSFSKKELQQRFNCRDPRVKWRGRRGADRHQSLVKMSDHFPPHPAARQRPGLQTRAGEALSQSKAAMLEQQKLLKCDH